MNYYRVYTGYNDFIGIDQAELEKAVYAFIEGSPVVFKQGATSRIDRIIPDYHRNRGWNPTHKLDDADWAELRRDGVVYGHTALFEKTKEKVEYLMHSDKKHLIGKNIDIPELSAPKSKLTGGLAEKMKLK